MAHQNQYPIASGNTLSELTRQFVYNGAASLGIDLRPDEINRIANSVMHTLTTGALKLCKEECPQ